jgi:hypothetical protein
LDFAGVGDKMNKDCEICMDERPVRKVLCQRPKGHNGSCCAVVFWENEEIDYK